MRVLGSGEVIGDSDLFYLFFQMRAKMRVLGSVAVLGNSDLFYFFFNQKTIYFKLIYGVYIIKS